MCLKGKLLSIAFYLSIGMSAYFILIVTSFSSFRIPTDSMQPTLQPGTTF